MITVQHCKKSSQDSLDTTAESKLSVGVPFTNTQMSDDSPRVLSPKLFSPRDEKKKTRRTLDCNTKSTITFLEKSKRATQHISSVLKTVAYTVQRTKLVKYNQKYTMHSKNERSPVKSTITSLLTNQMTMEKIEQTQQIYKEKIFQMNIYFSELSSKKVMGMYDLFVGSLTTEPLTDVVEYSYNNSKVKQKRCTLNSNFLVIASVNSQHKEIMYLHNPVISKTDNFGIVLNSSQVLVFGNEERQKQWLEAISKLSIWVESIPRTIMDQETPDGKTSQNDQLEMATPRKPIQNDQIEISTPRKVSTPPLSTPKKGNEKEPKKHLKSRSFLIKKDKHDKHDKHTKEERIKIFGVKLEEYAIQHQTTSLPSPISQLINFLKESGINKEGIFRICGSQDTIQSVKNKLELGDMSVLQTVDIHSLASTLKQYIREFPSQVIPPEIDQKFLQLYKIKQSLKEEEILSNYVVVLKLLPPIIYEFVKELTELLYLVLQNAESNKMTVENIFICLGPALRGCPFCYNFATTHYPEVFKSKNEEKNEEKIDKEEGI